MMKKVKMGMIGGSNDGFIGPVHRMAANLDGKIDLVCGCFSSHPIKSKETGSTLINDPNRIYSSYLEMIERESNLPAEERMDFVSIVTPNNLHFAPAKTALEHGFHVLCEKPLALTSKQGEILNELASEKNLLFGLTHNYTGYPMVKEAKHLITRGKLGKIRKIIVEYPQGWLSNAIEKEGQRQASWRTDPNIAGISCCMGDIGTHAENLLEYICDLKIIELSAEITTFVDGRNLDDDGAILLRLENGAKGVLMASQISNGEDNELKIRVYGEKGGIEWLQSNPNYLILKHNNLPLQYLKAGTNVEYLSEHAKEHCRLPAGHPEGYLEALANIYRNFSDAIHKIQEGLHPNPNWDFPSISDGLRGMRFIEAVIHSGENNSAWVSL